MSGTRHSPCFSRETAVWGGLPLSKQETTTQCAEYYGMRKCKVPWDTTMMGHIKLDFRGQERLCGEEVMSQDKNKEEFKL